jgi:cytoskeleton protein RodZ
VEAADDAPEMPTLGQTFADERERQGLSRAEVAQRLHMSAWQIEAFETGDYARLPKGTFLRGFVRNYAKALGLESGAALERLAETAPLGPSPRIVVPSQNIRFDPIGERLANPYVKAIALGVVFVSFAFAVMYWWLFIRPTPPAQEAARKAAELQQPTPQNLAAAPLPPPEAVVAAQAPIVDPVNEEPAALPLVAKPGPRKGLERTLKLRFKGESWVEVKDRSGKVLLSKLNTKGSEAEVSGRPPFDVVIGNAPDVEVLYDDREFPLQSHTRVAVARFTVQ